ncbi:MAG: MotA/TolQ/ExbB proton channel family protein [Alphaproteobacteria bacterium]|nr:MotA/TolQ/ExbB proton channel family protein [Alphaproteobacteria bacterium]
MFAYLVAGGPVMIPIAACSLMAVAVFLERLWSLRRGRVVPRAFCVEVVELVRQGRLDDATTRCRTHPVAAARVLESALELQGHPRARIRERLEEVGRREAADMERFVPVLGTIAAISPLLGLLGTVGGMILTFQVIQSEGLGNVGSLAGGISQALITTFAGLSVAIPTLIANRYVLSRVDAMLLELEEVASTVLDLLDPGEPLPVAAEG